MKSGLFLLVDVEDKEAPYRVLIENRSNAQLKLAAGTFVGRGGPGSLVSAPPERAPIAPVTAVHQVL